MDGWIHLFHRSVCWNFRDALLTSDGNFMFEKFPLNKLSQTFHSCILSTILPYSDLLNDLYTFTLAGVTFHIQLYTEYLEQCWVCLRNIFVLMCYSFKQDCYQPAASVLMQLQELILCGHSK